jgi:malate/lactate dehydrogenase
LNKIGIIGTGKLGTRLAEQLVLDGHFDEIWLWNRSQKKLRGTILSLNIWGSLLKTKTKIMQLDWKSLESLEIIIIAIKDKYDPRVLFNKNPSPAWMPHMLRYAGLLLDLPQVKSVCDKLINYRGIIAVVTNPVDIITSFVTHYVPKAKVFGLGPSIDSARLSYIASEELGQMLDYPNIPVGGEHGHNIVPLTSLWNLSHELNDAIKKRVSEWANMSNELGIRIVKDLGFTLQDCAVTFSHDISWLSGKIPNQKYAVFSVSNEVGSIGSPVSFEDGTTIKVRFDSLSDYERKQIENARSEITLLVNQLKKNIQLNW